MTLPAAGPAAAILHTAVTILTEHGWTQGITRDPMTGAVDVLGAIALAAGIPPKKIAPLGSDAILDTAPVARRPGAFYAWEALDAHLDRNPQVWNDHADTTVTIVQQVLTRVADALDADA